MISNKALKILLTIQSAAYLLAIWIIFDTSKDEPDDFSGIAAFFPMTLFNLLWFVNLVFLISYLVKLFKKKASLDVLLITLAVINTLFFVFYTPLVNFFWSIN